jgi:hypothetical protein
VRDGVGEQLFDDQRKTQGVARRRAAIGTERFDELDRIGKALHAGADGAVVRRGHRRHFRAG